jgi:NTP pyrophosphatase (non-canonical NTP hydrolase)
MNVKKQTKRRQDSPFGKYFNILGEIDKDLKNQKEFGSILILSLVEELGEMSRAYLAKHGRKGSNLAAQQDETYEQELGDILVTIIRFAKIKNINLDERIMYTLRKIKRRKNSPKL